MSYIKKATISISGSTASAVTSYSSAINGLVESVSYSSTSTIKKVITLGRESTGDVLLKFTGPGTLTNYYPQFNLNASTANSSSLGALMPFADQRVKATVPAASSANSKTALLTVYFL